VGLGIVFCICIRYSSILANFPRATDKDLTGEILRLRLVFVKAFTEHRLFPNRGILGIVLTAILVFPTSTFAALIIDNSANSTDSSPALWGVNVPATNQCQRVGQSFTLVNDTTVTSVRLRHSKQANPVDNLLMEIQSDAAGIPDGVALASSSYAGTSLPGSDGIVTVDYNVEVDLEPGTYWIVSLRSGSYDNDDYYRNYGTSASLVGEAKCDNSNAYATSLTNPDFYFQVYGTENTSNSTSTNIVSNPQQNVFNGFLLFFVSLFTMYILIKKA